MAWPEEFNEWWRKFQHARFAILNNQVVRWTNGQEDDEVIQYLVEQVLEDMQLEFANRKVSGLPMFTTVEFTSWFNDLSNRLLICRCLRLPSVIKRLNKVSAQERMLVERLCPDPQSLGKVTAPPIGPDIIIQDATTRVLRKILNLS
jgi:hypothetical protein